MYIGNCYEGEIEGEFVFSPLGEMFEALHVLAAPKHHLDKLKWSEETTGKLDPELLRRIMVQSEKTNEWCIMIDFIQEMIYEDVDIPGSLAIIERMNLVKWNRLFKPYGKRVTLEEKKEIVEVLKRFYLEQFQDEIKFLQPYIVFQMKKELKRCIEQGLINYVAAIHERIEVQDEVIIFHKNKDYRFEKSQIDKIQIAATTFTSPHLWLGEVGQTLCLTKLLRIGEKSSKAPEDLVKMLKAMGDSIRLEMLKEMKDKPQTTQGLATQLNLTEAGISKHLKVLYEAGIVRKQRKGNYIYYSLEQDRIDFIPYKIYEYMM